MAFDDDSHCRILLFKERFQAACRILPQVEQDTGSFVLCPSCSELGLVQRLSLLYDEAVPTVLRKEPFAKRLRHRTVTSFISSLSFSFFRVAFGLGTDCTRLLLTDHFVKLVEVNEPVARVTLEDYVVAEGSRHSEEDRCGGLGG